MFKSLRMPQMPVAARPVAVAVLVAACLLVPLSLYDGFRETAFDLVLAADARLRTADSRQDRQNRQDRQDPRIVVVDIDRRSLEALGPWPWPRATIAKLVETIAAAKPAAIAIDVLFAEPDSQSPAALARRLGALTARPELTTLAGTLVDGDELLAQAGNGIPIVLGFVLDPEKSGALREAAPVVMRGTPSLELWSAAGAVAPLPALTETAGGLGALSLPARRDGVVRYVPLLVGVGGRVLPGLALETVRVARGASTYLVQSEPALLATADLRLPFATHGLLRLVPVAPEARAARTVSAIDLLTQKADAAKLAGAVALVGGSAPELGGLRATATGPLTPSVQIHADAIQQISAGRSPRPVGGAPLTQQLFVIALGALALVASAALPPVLGAVAVVATVLLAWAIAIGASLAADRLVDPLTPSVAAAAAFAVAVTTSFAVTRRREILVRRRFEQHLAPAIVRRIVEQPGLVKLSGESREVTVLFTDVEGFTAMTHRADPEQLVAVLDVYFEEIAGIVVEHGGMVDKIVGDAVHALFNAPLDLDDHPRRAVDCAVAIHAWTQSYRAQPGPAAIGFGRTRIGVETGRVIVGDVGLSSKLDYTAYGDAVNAAARFEAANKELGSAICVGPAAAARCDAGMLRPLGAIAVRGRDDELAVFEPWPADAPPAWRERYLAAFKLYEHDPARAAELFDQLAAERKTDPVAQRMAERLRPRSVRSGARV
jgi:adenylate cyclase